MATAPAELEASETWLLGRGLLKSVLPFISGAHVISAREVTSAAWLLAKGREMEEGQQCEAFPFFSLETLCAIHRREDLWHIVVVIRMYEKEN